MKSIVLISFLSVLLVAGCTQQQQTTTTTIAGSTATTVATGAREVTVEITSAGFIPQTITINEGDTVTWVNSNSAQHWPASASHPTHTVYPGSGIEKCGTAEEPNIFDACRGIAPGSSYSFTFTEVGDWNYHDHLIPGKFGKVVVQG